MNPYAVFQPPATQLGGVATAAPHSEAAAQGESRTRKSRRPGQAPSITNDPSQILRTSSSSLEAVDGNEGGFYAGLAELTTPPDEVAAAWAEKGRMQIWQEARAAVSACAQGTRVISGEYPLMTEPYTHLGAFA